MKKIFLFLFIFSGTLSFAQQPKFLVGVNAAGVWNSYSLAKQEYPFSLDDRINWSLGVQSKYFIGKRIWLDGQINLATKNFGVDIDLRAVDFTAGIQHFIVKQSYVDIPISTNFLFGNVKNVSFFGTVGITNSVALSSRMSGGSPSSFSENSPFEKYKNYLVSLKTGGGILFPLGKNFYGSTELYSTIYMQRVHHQLNNPFQLALGFSILKKIGTKNISSN